MKVMFIKTLEQYIEMDVPDNITVEDLQSTYNILEWERVPTEFVYARCLDEKGDVLWES